MWDMKWYSCYRLNELQQETTGIGSAYFQMQEDCSSQTKSKYNKTSEQRDKSTGQETFRFFPLFSVV